MERTRRSRSPCCSGPDKRETHAYVECSACFVTEQSQPFISFTLGVLELEQERRLLRDAVGLYTR